MIVKAFLLPKGTEIYKTAEKYLKYIERGDPVVGWDLNEKKARWEAELDLADKEFWKEVREYIRTLFNEELVGNWHLTKLSDKYYAIEQDSVKGDYS